MGTAIQLRALVQREGGWEGTVSALAETLDDHEPASNRAPHLAIWLRRHEPTLWWDYGVRVSFSRTGTSRTVHLSLRDSKPGNSAVMEVSEELLKNAGG